MSKVPTVPENLTAGDMGCALHTALRKGCDSSPTSLVWNLIHLLEGPWGDYVEAILQWLKTTPEPTLTNFAAETVEQWEPFGPICCSKGISDRQRTLAVCMHCAFEMFSDDDWHGYTGYFQDMGIRLHAPQKLSIKKAAAQLDKFLRSRGVDELVSVGIGEIVERKRGIYINATKLNHRVLQIIQRRGDFWGHPIKLVRVGRFKPAKAQ